MSSKKKALVSRQGPRSGRGGGGGTPTETGSSLGRESALSNPLSLFRPQKNRTLRRDKESRGGEPSSFSETVTLLALGEGKTMKITMSEEQAKPLLSAFGSLTGAATKLMSALAKKYSWEAEFLEKKTPLTDDEVQRDLTISKLELDNRERKAKVEALELDAREARAVAEKADAQLKQRTINIRNSNLNRSTHKPKGSGVPSKSSPAAQERRNVVEGNTEGKSLTHSLGDKLKTAAPS